MPLGDLQQSDARLKPARFEELVGWADDDHCAAFAAFLPGARRMADTPYKTRRLEVNATALQRVAVIALGLDNPTQDEARSFFEQHFTPNHVELGDGDAGFVTGFFEPLVEASLHKTERFSVPLYRRPPELIDLDDVNRPPSMSAAFRFGRHVANGVEEYFDRPAIQAGALEGRDLELVWLENKVDAFFIHVQGSAKLALPNGNLMRTTYAAKSGHAYTSVAKVLCQQTGIPPEKMTADRLSDWMHANTDLLDELLAHNRSYIFFKEIEGLDPNDGPVAAAKVPLIAGRSLAVDRTLHTFGVPIWLTTDDALPGDVEPLARLMIAHDTGSAIVGPARGDIFTGTGDAAGLIAGRIRHGAKMTIFVPNPDLSLGGAS